MSDEPGNADTTNAAAVCNDDTASLLPIDSSTSVESNDAVTIANAIYSGSDLPPPPSRRRSVKDRFEDAKKQQQRAEVERMGKIRNETTLSNNGPGKITGKWSDVLATSRDKEATRFQAKRRETISQWQTAEAVGIVEKRVKQFEELYMQLAASIDKMEATIRAVKKNTKKWKKKTSEINNDVSQSGVDKEKNSTEIDPTEGIKIRCGQTATLWVDPFYFTSIIPLLAANGNQPVSLPTGVYSGESSSPHLEVVAVAIFDSNSGEPYLAVTVDYSEGYIGDPSAHGRKKIAIFAPVFNEMIEIFSDVFFVIDREDKEVTEFENEEEINSSTFQLNGDESSDVSQNVVAGVTEDYPDSADVLVTAAVDIMSSTDFDEDPTISYDNKISVLVKNNDAVTEDVDNNREDDYYAGNDDCRTAVNDEAVNLNQPSADLDKSNLNCEDLPGTKSTDLENESQELNINNLSVNDSESFNEDLALENNPTENATNILSDSKVVSKTDLLIKESIASRETAREALLSSIQEENLINNSSVSNLDSESSLNDQNSGRSVLFNSPGALSDSLGSASFDENDESFEGEGLSPLSTKNRLKSKAEIDSIFSFAAGPNLPEVKEPVLCKAGSHPITTSRSDWSAMDELQIDLPIIQKTVIQLDVRRITGISSSSSCFLSIFKSGSDRSEESDNLDESTYPSFSTIAVLGTMQSTIHSTQLLVRSTEYSNTLKSIDTVFEWIRGAAFSGWGYKWPMKRQKAGRRTTRFFILRDDLVSYHAREPRSAAEAHADYALHSLRLKPGSSISKSRKFFQDCVQVETPIDTLVFRSKNNTNQTRWIRLLQEALDRYSKGPAFLTKDIVECNWRHELPECCCVAVDAEILSSGYFIRASLYCIDSGLSEPQNSTRQSSMKSFFGRITQSFNNENENSTSSLFAYVVDISRSGDREPLVFTLADVPVYNNSTVDINFIKIVGDYIILGGSLGFVGIFSYVNNEGLNIATVENCQIGVSQSVSCIAGCQRRGIAVIGDNEGGICAWLPVDSSSKLLSTIRGYATGGRLINNIQFVPHRDFMIVSTYGKQLIVGIKPELGSYIFEGIAELSFDSIFTSVSAPSIGNLTSLSNIGSESGEEIFLMCCIAFPSSDGAVAESSVRHDIGNLRFRSIPRQSVDRRPEESLNEQDKNEPSSGERSIIIWRAITKVSAADSPRSSLMRIESTYNWLDMHAAKMGEILSIQAVGVTLTSDSPLISKRDEALLSRMTEVTENEQTSVRDESVDISNFSRTVDYSVDFTIVHQV